MNPSNLEIFHGNFRISTYQQSLKTKRARRASVNIKENKQNAFKTGKQAYRLLRRKIL